jgi:hypothetical protein
MAAMRKLTLTLLLLVLLVREAAAGPIDWSGVDALVEAFAGYSAYGVLVGNSSGLLHTYAKGGFDLSAPVPVASASKWPSASIIFRGTLQGASPPLTLRSRPVDWVPAWAGIGPSDPRSNITLGWLLNFTDGMSTHPCADGDNASSYTFNQCMTEIVQAFAPANGSIYTPGTTFYYSGVHLHVAGAMAARAAGFTTLNPWPSLVASQFVTPLGFSALSTFYTPLANPLIAGGLVISPLRFATWLQTYFNGTYLSPAAKAAMEAFALPPGLVVASTPVGAYRYGYGHWIECRRNSTSAEGPGSPFVCNNASACASPPLLQWRSACANGCERSSPGKFGFYPYQDTCFGVAEGVTQGYWAIIATDATGDTATSLLLGNTLWPAIRAAFLSQRTAGTSPTPTPTARSSAAARVLVVTGPWHVLGCILLAALLVLV